MSNDNNYPGSWPGGPKSKDEFEETCIHLSQNLFNFKRNPIFCAVINNDGRGFSHAKEMYNVIEEKCPDLLKIENLNKFTENDKIGNPPKVYEFNNVNISPGTIIFMKVLSDIYNFENVNSIVEIGTGYGGQCKIIKDYLDVNYTCVDNSGCLTLCKSYLKKMNVEAEFVESDNVPNITTDLVISNYCLSELDNNGIDFYFEKIIKNSKYIYFTLSDFNEDNRRYAHLLKRCKELFDVQLFPIHKNHPNYIISGIKK